MTEDNSLKESDNSELRKSRSLHQHILEIIMENGFLIKQENWNEEQMEIRAIYDAFRIINLIKGSSNDGG